MYVLYPSGTGFQHVCESVFVRLCQIVGTSVQVAFRWETRDIKELVDRLAAGNDDVIHLESGSRREGFRLEGSDVDIMFWPNDYRVIWDLIQSEHYDTASKNLILADSSMSPPGFTLLESLTPTTYSEFPSACIRVNDRLYISSSLFRGTMQSNTYPNSIEHGPCESSEIMGKEYDMAWCFACDIWPSSASSWIDRCRSWPEKEVVNTIVRNGCHFVPIGNPLGLQGYKNEEWRISFSLAEQKLVYTMNHCQFLVYGLLKIFLKEVIDNLSEETNKLLCSYHMKTVVFWVIQGNAIPLWCPQNFLVGFWSCFKLLIKWVYEGVCPNFFIPQNNMFLSKVHGSAQRSLFLKLHHLYEQGLVCLLQSPSIRLHITDVLYNPRLFICTDENRVKFEGAYDTELFSEIMINRFSYASSTSMHYSVKYLRIIDKLIKSPLTQYQIVMVQKLAAPMLQDTVFTFNTVYTSIGFNKQVYIADKMSCHMLRIAANLGGISEMVYNAMFFYKNTQIQRSFICYREYQGYVRTTGSDVQGQSRPREVY